VFRQLFSERTFTGTNITRNSNVFELRRHPAKLTR
jgi:hypothetical protein